jgi:hypothetical protein
MIEETKEEIKEEESKPVKVIITKEMEVEIFKLAAHKSYKDIGYQYGIQYMFPGEDNRVSSYIYDIIRKIKKAPEIWGISEDLVEVVQTALDKRNVKKNPAIKSDIALEEESFRDKLDGMRDTVAEIITKKLNKYNTKKGVDEVSIRDLKDLLAMAIDKSRLLKGESTENIVKMSKIDTENLSPEDAMKVILKARELMLDSKK